MRHFKIPLVCCIILLLTFQSCRIDEVDELIEIPYEPCSPCTLECKTPDTERAKSMLDSLEKNSSVGYQILNMTINSCYPVKDYADGDVLELYLRNHMSTFAPSLSYPPFMDTVYSLPTIVHEAYHGISRIHNGNKDCCTDKEYYHFVESNAEVIVDRSIDYNTTYPNLISEKVRKTLPEKFRDNMRIDRYLFYQKATVYSLLNEFAAYYFGVRTGFDFIPYHIEEFHETQEDAHLKLAVQNVEGGITAYYEFKYSILLYLSTAKKYAPDYYKNVQQNTAFWTIFNKVDQSFSQLIEDYKFALATHPEMKNHSFSHLENQSVFAEEIGKLSYLIVNDID